MLHQLKGYLRFPFMQSNTILIISISRRKNAPTVRNWRLVGCHPSCEVPIAVLQAAWVQHRTAPGSRATPRSLEDVTSCRWRQRLQNLRHHFLPQESNPLTTQSSVKMVRDTVLTKDVRQLRDGPITHAPFERTRLPRGASGKASLITTPTLQCSWENIVLVMC